MPQKNYFGDEGSLPQPLHAKRFTTAAAIALLWVVELKTFVQTFSNKI
jgi:hypothetical protein